jgi:hypothetical protein
VKTPREEGKSAKNEWPSLVAVWRKRKTQKARDHHPCPSFEALGGIKEKHPEQSYRKGTRREAEH